jgi:hypothetical protein
LKRKQFSSRSLLVVKLSISNVQLTARFFSGSMLPLKYAVLFAAILSVTFHSTWGKEKKPNKGTHYLSFKTG